MFKSEGIFQGDLIIKTAIELAMEDIRQNPWLIEDMFQSITQNPYLNYKYGMKEVNRAREFLLNNQIPVYMAHRVDSQEFPCITITIGESNEDTSLATLGDATPFVEQYSAEEVDQTIQYIVPPFTPVSYDPSTGIVEVPTDVEEYEFINPEMIAVDPDTGNGYIVIEKAGTNGFRIIQDAEITSQLAIVPRYAIYRARRERVTSQESYNIGCHVEGDPSTLIFLHSMIKYALWRYKEGLLEASNFQLSKIKSTDFVKNEGFGAENVYSRWVQLSGQVEETWVKTPYRPIEAISLRDGLETGIKICSNSEPNLDPDDLWEAIDTEES